MPYYVYSCTKCWNVWEERRSVVDRDGSTTCECGAPGTRKVVVPVAFTLKGGGWAKDGYSKNK